MDDALLVSGFERFGDLPGDPDRLVDLNWSPCDALIEALAFDEFQNEELRSVRFLQPVDRRNARMIERGEHLRFPAKAGDPLRIIGEG